MSKPSLQTEAGAMTVPLLDLTGQFRSIESDVYKAIEGVMSSGRYIMGPVVESFEKEVARYCDVPNGIGCASGTDALILALRALRVGRGDEVVTPAYSFFSSTSCISLCGATPVFCDIEPDTYNIDTAKLEEAITPKTKAIIVVHLFGQCANMDEISAIAKKHGVAVVEDAAQSLGASWNGKRSGGWGDMGCFSFFPTKNLGGAGDGGMIVTTRDDLADRLRLLRMHGSRPKYHHIEIGLNSRLDPLQAAILQVKLPHLDEWAKGRSQNADIYREKLSGVAVGLPLVRPQATHVYNQFVIRSQNRDALRSRLQESGVGTEIYYPIALHRQPCFEDLGYREGAFPVAETAARETIALPIFPELSEDQLAYVADRIREFTTS